jgi:hypothetical protein
MLKMAAGCDRIERLWFIAGFSSKGGGVGNMIDRDKDLELRQRTIYSTAQYVLALAAYLCILSNTVDGSCVALVVP